MKKPLSQIAFDFFGDPGQGGVGIRIKSLKKEAATVNLPIEIPITVNVEEPTLIELTAPIDETVSHEASSPIEEPQTQPGAAILMETETPAAAERPRSTRGRKSLKQSAAEADLIDIPDDETLFSKQYYTMGEVAAMFRVNQSLLRFWETEFSILQPKKNKKGDRHFRPVDIKNLHLIHHLLRQRKYTIEGAKEFLKKNKKVEERFDAIKRLQQVRSFLLEWKAQL